MFVGGIVCNLLHIATCELIVEITSQDDDGLKNREVWINWHQCKKANKTRKTELEQVD